MKKIIAILLTVCAAGFFSISAYALSAGEEPNGTNAVISTSVPYFHTITADADGARVTCGGIAGNSFSVDRLSEPVVIIRAESGKRIKRVLLNGTDITAQINDGCYVFEPVYEDKRLTVITESAEEHDTQGESHEDNPITGVDVNIAVCLLFIIAAFAGVISVAVRRS